MRKLQLRETAMTRWHTLPLLQSHVTPRRRVPARQRERVKSRGCFRPWRFPGDQGMIEVDQLTVRYDDEKALDGLSLRLRPGEFVLVTGPSGCGKSTLARALAGLIPHASSARMTGRVVVNGLDTRQHPLPILAGHVGLVFQNPATQLFCLRVEEEVAFGPRNLGLPAKEVARRVEWALAAAGLEHLRGRRVNALSDGEKQRLAIASILAMGPRILVLDEPTSNLDLAGARQVLATLERLRREAGTTVVIVEHKTGEIANACRTTRRAMGGPEPPASVREVGRLADRVLLLEKGRLVADGPPEEVFARREMLRRLGVRHPAARPQSDWADRIATGEDDPFAKEPLVELEGVAAGYGESLVLDGLDLSIGRGEFVALVGDNGSGKTTLARLLAGLLKPRRGR
ncbi:MAG TPA: ATP-binding cassette domain-containing protein, partial [Anaerolineae bacterium]|nr:ATP-binding cassette domain-containing protein [Anaerolineae bacterium]